MIGALTVFSMLTLVPRCVSVEVLSKVLAMSLRGCQVEQRAACERSGEPAAVAQSSSAWGAVCRGSGLADRLVCGCGERRLPRTKMPWLVPATMAPSLVSASANTSRPSSPALNCCQCTPASTERKTPPNCLSLTTPA